MYKIDDIKMLRLGQRDENLAREIPMDASEWLELYPGASITILFRRPGESTITPMITTLIGSTLTWQINDFEVGITGVGNAEIRAVDVNGLRRKSRIIPCSIEETLLGDDETVLYTQDQVDVTLAHISEAAQAAQAAQASEEAAALSAQEAGESAASAGTAADVATSARDAAQAAQTAAETAQHQAEAAQSGVHADAEAAEQAKVTAQAAQAGAQGAASQASADRTAAESARADAEAAAEHAEEVVEGIDQAGADQVAAVNAAGQAQVTAVNAAGTTQVGNVNTAGTTQVNAVQAKGTEVINSIPADYSALTDKVTDLKSAFDSVIDIDHSDLLYGKTPIENWFISYDDTTGVGQDRAGFYSYKDVPIPAGTDRLWPYNNVSDNVQYIRTILFFTSEHVYISGVSGSNASVQNSVMVPSNAAYVSCTLKTPSTGYDGKHYLSTKYGGDYVTNKIDGEIQADDVAGTVLNNNERIACINFQFDDGHANDANIVSIFTAKGLTCGFAIIGDSGTDIDRYHGYQKNGFEILSHSINATGMDDPTVSADTIENKLFASKSYLERYGLKVNGFVTPNSTMARVFKPLLRKYYQFAETEYLGEYTGSNRAYMLPTDGVYNGWRVSLQSTTLANQKDAVDKAIDNYGIVTFYGHSASLDGTNNLTTANLNELLTYILAKVAAGKCRIGNPSDMIRYYFNVRNDDVADDWVPVTATEANLDSNFNVNLWSMRYNKKLKLLHFMIRVNPTEAVSGQIDPLFTFPVSIDGNDIINSETGRNCIVYGNGLLIQGNNTWESGTNYRFSGMLKIK